MFLKNVSYKKDNFVTQTILQKHPTNRERQTKKGHRELVSNCFSLRVVKQGFLLTITITTSTNNQIEWTE